MIINNSKDSSCDPDLTVRLRGGNRDLLDGQLRYVTTIGDRITFKISGGAIVVNDFLVDNQSVTSTLIEPSNNAAGSSLGYDAVSRYGDTGNTFMAAGGALAGKTVFLPGYTEGELVAGDNKTHSYKITSSLSVSLTNSPKATIDYKYTNTNTIYQSAGRYRFVNSGAHQGRMQLEGNNWFVRAFTTHDYLGGRDPQTDGFCNLDFLGGQLPLRVDFRHRHRAHGSNRGRAGGLHNQEPAHHGSGGRYQSVRCDQLPSVRRAELRPHRLLRAAVRH